MRAFIAQCFPWKFTIKILNHVYNAGKILERSMTEYRLKHDDDPGSLYKVDEEAEELFLVSTGYIQLLEFPGEELRSPFVIAKTATLHDHPLPLSAVTYHTLRENSVCFETLPHTFPFTLRLISMIVHDMDSRPYILQLALSLQEVRTTLNTLLFIFSVLFPLLLAISSVLGYFFMKRAFAPVKKMVDVTRRITAEDLSLRLAPVENRDEIGELAETLNEMISRLECSFKQIRQFSGDVAHELKTPLTELKCNAEVALRRNRTAEEYQEALRNVIDDAEQLRQIVEDLLLLAKMDARSLPLNFTPVALDEMFIEVFEQMHPQAQHKHLAINFDDIAQATVSGDTGLLKRLIANLISNAIRYTPSGGTLTFALHTEDEQAVLTITDTGVGIPEDALPHIFDRFYRVEQSRSHDTGGSGLGLAIAQKIAEVHEGRITVNSEVETGTTFHVYFPCL